MSSRTLTAEIVNAAIMGMEVQKTNLDAKIAELRAMLNGSSATPEATPESEPPKRKKFSAASRLKMAMAQKARWAKIRGESVPSTPAATPEPAKVKRKLSAAGRAAIVAATKKRWALIHKAEKAAPEKA